MARDLAEQERAFIDALPADTGRGLAGWMAAIADSGLGTRNDIIDWLRQQGFTFSNASWLERIHHNGGRLIYGEVDLRAVAAPIAERARAQSPAAKVTEPAGEAAAGERPEPVPVLQPLQVPERLPEWAVEPGPAHSPTPAIAELNNKAVSAPSDGASEADVSALLTAAKGLRPLAELVLREMDGVIPGLTRNIEGPFLVIASPAPVAALLPQPKDIRLYADFGPEARDRTKKADAARAGQIPYPDMLVLNDARQIDGRFRELVALAYTRTLK